MNAIYSFIAWLGNLMSRMGICASAGVVVGMANGGILALANLMEGPLSPDASQLLLLWLILTLFGWLLLLFVLVVLSRLTLASVGGPSLVNSALVTGLLLLLCNALSAYGWAFWLGILCGILVGLLLCGLYRAVKGG